MLEVALATAGVCLPAADFIDTQIDGIVRHCLRGPSRRPAGNGGVSKSTTGTGGVSAVSVWEGAAAGSAASEWRVSSTEAPSCLHGAAGKPPDGAEPGGADGTPPSDSGGPRSAEPGAATAMTSASAATRIMAKRMVGWL